ncbi:hypothetical protein AB0I81_51065 [Nonomuraea sp. NPDC050404]|uniref:hypothetical protein n=1 Tax=Nonomuraea sp. NPDC050404 TaxID=3155783 RepID=UPI0033EA2AC4
MRLGVGLMAAAAIMAPATAHAADAPYAQAYAIVAADGTLQSSKNIASVTKYDTGKYCIAVDPSVTVTSSTPIQATARSGSRTISAYNWPNTECNNKATNTVTVFTFRASDGTRVDTQFYLTIP